MIKEIFHSLEDKEAGTKKVQKTTELVAW
jgi:hypothetical protein